MYYKVKAIIAILQSQRFVLVHVKRSSMTTKAVNWGTDSLSVNILISSILLRMYEQIKTKTEEQSIEAGQLRTYEAVRDAVQALEMTDDDGGK